jgi:poly(A) polymerase
LRGASGAVPQSLVEWWTRFQTADDEERQAMLRPEEAPKKRRRPRSRRKRSEGANAQPAPEE